MRRSKPSGPNLRPGFLRMMLPTPASHARARFGGEIGYAVAAIGEVDQRPFWKPTNQSDQIPLDLLGVFVAQAFQEFEFRDDGPLIEHPDDDAILEGIIRSLPRVPLVMQPAGSLSLANVATA